MCVVFYLHILAACLHLACSGTIETVKYKRFTKATTSSSKKVSARSKLECASFCSRRPPCVSFTFDSDKKICEYSDDHLEYSSLLNPLPATNCALFPTYTFNTQLNICYRIVTSGMKKVDAFSECQTDDPSAHIVTLRNNDMLQFFTDSDDINDFWIDGDYLFQTWDHKPLPWASWCSGEPTMDSGKTLRVQESGPCMKEDSSTASKAFVCQIG